MNIGEFSRNVCRKILGDMPQGGLRRNVIFSFMQAVVSATCVFFTFRVVINNASLSDFGIASVLLAFGAVAKVGDISGAGSLSRLIPVEIKEGREKNTSTLIHTAICTNLMFFLFIVFSFWVFDSEIIGFIFKGEDFNVALSLFPMVLIQIIFSSVSVGVSSAIDGVLRSDLRALLVMSAYITLPIWTAIFVHHFGVSSYLIGLVLQHALIICVGWILLQRFVDDIGWFPFKWDKNTFQRTLAYVMKLNVMMIFAFAFEPVAKVVIQISAGSSSVALYEVASRAVHQVRNIIVSASTPIIPKFATYKRSDNEPVASLLYDLTKFYAWASVGIALILIVFAPVVSWLVMKEVQEGFLITMLILTAGWSCSVAVIPFYFLAQAFGTLRWNIAGHAAAVAILGGGALLVGGGSEFYIVLVVSLSIIVSSVIFLFGNLTHFHLHPIRQAQLIRIAISVASIFLLCGGAIATTRLISQ